MTGLNWHQERALKMLQQRPRRLRDLTHCHTVDLAHASSPLMEQYMRELMEQGYVTLTADLYAITEAGKDWLQEQEAANQLNARRDGQTYRGPKWNLRKGSQDFLRCQSGGAF